MGLMSWLRGGRSAGDGDAVPEVGVPVDRSDRVDVRRLAPMQRTLPEQGLVINPVGFQGELTTRQPTALSTPLGHLVSPDAPTGVLHGITTPTPGNPVPPVQRSVDMPSRRMPGGEGALPMAGGSSVELPAAVPASVAVPAAVPVQRAASSTMTTAGTSTIADLPVRQLVGEQPLLPTSTPPTETETETVEPPSAPPTRRTPGLGAPLAGLPPTAQRQVAASVPGSGAPEASPSPVVRPPAEPETSPDVDSVPPPVAPLLGDDPLMDTAPEPGDEPPAPPPPASLQRSVAHPAPPRFPPLAPPPVAAPTVPLLGDRPLTPRTAVQRDVRGGTEPPQTEPAPASVPAPAPVPVPVPVPVRWTPSGPSSSAPPPPSASEPLQRSAVVPHVPTALAAAALPVQRQARGGPPVPGSLPRTDSGGAPLPTAGAFAVAAGVAQRMPDGSVVFTSSSPASFASDASRPVVQRDAELSEEPPPPDTGTGNEPEPSPEPGPEPVSADGAPGAAPPRTGAGAPAVTDELVRALYAPLSRLLKADLRLERERAGFLINTRH